MFRWATVRQGIWVIAVKGQNHHLIRLPSRWVSAIPGHGNKGFLCEHGLFTHTCSSLSPQEILGKTGAACSCHLSFLGHSSDPGSSLGCRWEGDAYALPCAQGKVNVSTICFVYSIWTSYWAVHGVEVWAGNHGGSQPPHPAPRHWIRKSWSPLI